MGRAASSLAADVFCMSVNGFGMIGIALPKLSLGGGVPTVNVRAAEVPPPGEELNTVTRLTLGLAISDAGIVAVNCVLFTTVVGRSPPFQRTLEDETNPLPFAVSVKPGPLGAAMVGLMEFSTGRGLVTENGRPLVVLGAGCAESKTSISVTSASHCGVRVGGISIVTGFSSTVVSITRANE